MLQPSCLIGWERKDGENISDIGDSFEEHHESNEECPPVLTMCNGICVNISANHENCGECGKICQPLEVCSDGECKIECPEGKINCSGSCVNTEEDILNCGECGNICPASLNADPVCRFGTCKTICHPGWSDMNGDGSCETNCVPASEGEICNAIDDDCDTLIDEDFNCIRGETSRCITSCGSIGNRTCSSSCTWNQCQPPLETCNGWDDDCDIFADEDFDCTQGETSLCITACSSEGNQTCSSSCTWGQCQPPEETCNGRDDNCDGLCDEAYECCAGTNQNCSIGLCSGTKSCSSSCLWGICNTGPAPANDTCSGATNATTGTYTGTTCGAANDFSAGCVTDSSSPDVVMILALSTRTPLIFSTSGSNFDTVLSIRSGSCSGAEIACDDNGSGGGSSIIDITLDPGNYWIVIDGKGSSSAGNYVLNIAIKESCTSAGGLEYNGSCYKLFDSILEWPEASNQCATWGGHLVTIGSEAENNFVLTHFATDRNIWIGFNDESVEGTWVWVTGEHVTYTNWYPGEPNNANGDEDWGNMWAGSGLWNDCGPGCGSFHSMLFVCERPL